MLRAAAVKMGYEPFPVNVLSIKKPEPLGVKKEKVIFS
jgi:hypothetical protein